MVEIITFLVAGISGLFITGFSVHMLAGGLVSPETENQLIFVACVLVFCVMAYMAWDVVERRAGRK
ncbi:MAG: hypothetical protein WC216_00855 [Gallionella sp.]|jgi:hypothetical protein